MRSVWLVRLRDNWCLNNRVTLGWCLGNNFGEFGVENRVQKSPPKWNRRKNYDWCNLKPTHDRALREHDPCSTFCLTSCFVLFWEKTIVPRGAQSCTLPRLRKPYFSSLNEFLKCKLGSRNNVPKHGKCV